jgi:hypothetical protein
MTAKPQIAPGRQLGPLIPPEQLPDLLLIEQGPFPPRYDQVSDGRSDLLPLGTLVFLGREGPEVQTQGHDLFPDLIDFLPKTGLEVLQGLLLLPGQV